MCSVGIQLPYSFDTLGIILITKIPYLKYAILKYNYLYCFSPSSHLNRCKIISSERFRVHEHIFSEAGLLLKYL